MTGASTSFGSLLRVYRAGANITQEELAGRSGLSVQAISALERGLRRTPRSSTVALLAEALDLDDERRRALLAAANSGRAGWEAASPVPAGLPRSIGDFTGRAAEVALLRDALERDGRHAPAVAVITGMAGAGKTALAVQVANLVRGEFPNGQLYADLGGAEDRPAAYGDVLTAFLRSLGVDGSAIPREPEDRLVLYRTRLADRRLLVLLDNAGSEGQVRPLIPTGPGSAALVTSRTALVGLEAASQLPLSVLDSREALELLARVAGRQRTGAERDAAREIVRLVGGLPLAIRVAGARLASRPAWSLSGFAARLADERRRLDELRAGDLEVRASLALSYRGLDEETRRCFRLLGVLEEADFPAWLAAALFDQPFAEAEARLERLVDAGLLETPDEDGAGQVRYRLHALLRAFAGELLAGDSAAVRETALGRALGARLALAERAQRALAPGAAAELLTGDAARCPADPAVVDAVTRDPFAWFDAERPAHVAAVLRAGRAGLDELAWELSASVSVYLTVRGLWQDAYAAHEEAMRAASAAGNSRGELQAALLVAGARLWLLDVDGAETYAHRAIALAGELGDRCREGQGLGGLAMAAQFRHDAAAAIEQAERALALLRATNSRHGEAVVLYVRGMALRERGRAEEAEADLRSSRAIFSSEGERLMVGVAELGLADLHEAAGRAGRAERCLVRALDVFDDLDSRLLAAIAQYRLVTIRLSRWPRQQAIAMLEECARSFRELGLRPHETAALDRLSALRSPRDDVSTTAG